MSLLRHPATGVWLLLMLATALSWWFGTNHAPDASQHLLRTTFMLVLIAFVKVSFVIMYFMEVRTAPWALRMIGGVWPVAVGAAILIVYVTA